MKILILGGTGMAGHTISLYFKEVGHDVTAFSRSKVDFCKNINGDITDFINIKKIINEGQYDAIINAIGILNQDAEDNKATAVLLNSYLPHFLSDTTKDMKTKIIHMSTDCVFSGEYGPYIEISPSDGTSFYSKSKALGEIDNTKDLTFRTSIIGPDLNIDGKGLLNWFMNQKREAKGYSNAIWTGVTSLVFAKAAEKAIEENVTGIYQLVNDSTISKYELLRLFNSHMKNNPIKILPDSSVKSNKALINTKESLSYNVPPYEKMIGMATLFRTKIYRFCALNSFGLR